MNTYDPIQLEIFKHLYAAVAEEMGAVLRKASYSPNIKERRDYSCALFDAQANMIAQAAHIPVHLGSMPLSVKAAIEKFSQQNKPSVMSDRFPMSGMHPGDVIMLNDPFQGGTHLPDITLVTPVFVPADLEGGQGKENNSELVGFVASRAHHADVGGMTPGSMPVGTEIYQEGLIIPPVKLIRQGELDQGIMDMILANVRTPDERAGDLWAQIAANQRGVQRLSELAASYGIRQCTEYMAHLLIYTERLTRNLLAALPDGIYKFSDRMDDDGITDRPVWIRVSVTIEKDSARVDFSDSDRQQSGSINAVYAITLSAVYYVFRSLLGIDVPNNMGCLVPIEVIAPPGSVVNAKPPAAVAGGNVETSQRIVDVLLGAFAQADPERLPAASQGTMNNVTIGGFDPRSSSPFTYYETIGGGMGARPYADGPSAIHSHMTNTLNTPIEALEYAYPLRVLRYEVRAGSGGGGAYRGGDGIRRDIETLVEAQVTLLSERRRFAPYGLSGGQAGKKGENLLIRDGVQTRLPGKGTFNFKAGDVLSASTPGGGGYGDPYRPKRI